MASAYIEKTIAELKNTNLKKFKEKIQLVDTFILDENSKRTIKLNMVVSDDVCSQIEESISSINLDKLEVNSLNLEFVKLRHNCLKAIKEADSASGIAEKRLLADKAYTFYEYLNAIIKRSMVRNKILEMFKEEFGNLYSEKIRMIEEYTSPLFKKIKQKEIEKLKNSSEAIEMYLLLKKWQESQKNFYNSYFYPWLVKILQSFNIYFEKNVGEHLLKVSKANRLACLLLDNIPIIPIDTVSRFIHVCDKKDLAYIVGYKNVGLAILNNERLYIPKTYAISVGSLIKGLYVSELMKLQINRIVVRSSISAEESKSSFAGMFTAVLNVEKISVFGAIGNVYSGISSKKVKEYIQRYGKEQPYMAIVLQEYIVPTYSGIWVGQNMKTGHLEWVKGNRPAFESEENDVVYENWTFAEEKIKNKLIFKQIPIGKVCIKLQEILNTIADFEWCIMDNKLVWLQYNSVTK